MRFTLEVDKWYACEFIGEEFADDKCSYSPIRIHGVMPHGKASREYVLSFYHANYPEGVRDKSYHLRTIERGSSYLLARAVVYNPVRFLQIYNIDEGWVERHLGVRLNGDACCEWLSRNV